MYLNQIKLDGIDKLNPSLLFKDLMLMGLDSESIIFQIVISVQSIT